MKPSEKSLYEYLCQQAKEYPEKKMLGGPEGWLTFQDILVRIERTAVYFSTVGVRPGELVAVRAYRDVETICAILALRLLGAVVVLVNPMCDVQEALEQVESPIPVSHIVAERLEVQRLPEIGRKFPARTAKEIGFLIFTSGSTGKSKAVMLSEYNLVNNLIDSAPLGYYREDDIALGALPLDHVFGLVLLAGTMVLGYRLYLLAKTDVPSILNAIQTEKITRMNGVPPLYLSMAEKRDDYDLSSLRAGFIGGGPVTAEQFCRVERELGMTLIPVYGMSECIGISCASYRDSQMVRAFGVGPFYSMNTGKILREDGTEAAVNEEGEICVDGPARMAGYYGDSLSPSPLLHTGDIGFLDEQGILHISGRKKDIIVRNGVNLSPKRIEDALLALPYIEEACVIGLPDERLGEVPYAMVVCQDGAPEVISPELPKNELPAGFLRVNHLPLTHSGKPDKQRIREVLRQWKNG